MKEGLWIGWISSGRRVLGIWKPPQANTTSSSCIFLHLTDVILIHRLPSVFTVAHANETFVGVRIYEITMELKVNHYVWSGMPYASEVGSYFN
jgi:hypothetical protein